MCADKNRAKQVPKNSHRLVGSERPRPRTHTLVGPADGGELLAVTVVLRRKPGAPALPDLNYWQNTPLRKQRILSPTEYAQTYGAHPDDVERVSAVFSAMDMTVLNSHAGRRTMTVQGTVAQMNEAFGITLQRYQAPLPRARSHRSGKTQDETPAGTQRHLGYDGPLHVPEELAGLVTAVVGLDDRCVGAPGGGSGSPPNSNSLSVPTVAGYYNFPNIQVPDQTVGVIAPSDPPSASSPRLSGYLKNDLTVHYFPSLAGTGYATAPASFNDIGLTVGTNTYSNSTASATAANNFSQEVTQDIATSTTIAQGCTLNVYFTELSENGLLVCLNRILLPETEKQPTVVTCSFNFFGTDDSLGSPTDPSSAAYLMSEQFQQLASVGVNVFLISQDEGSDGGDKDGKTHVVYPGSDPWATCCGGTVIGDVTPGPPLQFEEWVWSDAGLASPVGGFGGASGGGASATFPIPPYQSAAGLTSIKDTSNNVSTNRRFVPDIAGMVSLSGFYINGSLYPDFTGTSCVAPLYAGLFAVLRSAFGVAFGFLNPILYQLESTFNDITTGNNDPNDGSGAPYYLAKTGWDPCTGLGSVDGTKLLNGIASLLYNSDCYFQVNKGTYGLDEVQLNPSYSNTISLVLEGFTPAAVTAAGLAPTVATSLPGVTVTVGAAQPEIASQTSTPQRILFPCTVAFDPSKVKTEAQGGIFPDPGSPPTPTPVDLISSISINEQTFAPFTQIQLEAGDDPYFSNFDPTGSNPFYLSQDLRVFTVTPGINKAPIDGVISLNPANNTDFDTQAGFSYIQRLLSHLNSTYGVPSTPDPFTLFPDQSSALSGDSSVTPTAINPADPTGKQFANYNFAVARVRLSGAPGSSGSNVRVLFRLFASQTNDTDYQSSTYPSTTDSQGQALAPLLGADNVTIPFFATGNYQANADFQINADYSANSINNQPVNIPSGGTAWAYYGCYLNLYPTKNTINMQSVQSMLPSTHSCVVAQLAYDNAPMPTGPGVVQGPEYSDNFAQRNLQITFSDNPGPAATHRVPQTFDVRPSPALGSGDLLNYPDELMIEWGNTPVGSTAYIYWPQVAVSDVLALAKQLYSTHQLSAADANTVQVTVPRGFTFVPIPPGTGQNFAGLFTVDLPAGVKAGQVYSIVVRRVSSRRGPTTPVQQPPPAQPKIAVAGAVVEPGRTSHNWRYIVGTFAVQIPVTTAKVMLGPEENTLAIMKWRLEQTSPWNRWYPVLQRYIGYVVGRVNGLGGNAGTIVPSPWGVVPVPSQPSSLGQECTGKIAGLIYDHFGEFEAFLLETADCEVRRFCSREKKIELVVREAWRERSVVTVVIRGKEPCCLISIILGGIHPPCRCD